MVGEDAGRTPPLGRRVDEPQQLGLQLTVAAAEGPHENAIARHAILHAQHLALVAGDAAALAIEIDDVDHQLCLRGGRVLR
jgi:hypothetical protein